MSHDHEVASDLTFEEKLNKLLHHWIKHNEDHAGNYRDWKEKAEKNHMKKAAAILEEAAALTIQINQKFETAIKTLKN